MYHSASLCWLSKSRRGQEGGARGGRGVGFRDAAPKELQDARFPPSYSFVRTNNNLPKHFLRNFFLAKKIR